jgi:tetratricopeptide (TPR) repeat protein
MEGKKMSTHIEYEINKELGECYLFMGDYDKAEEYYKKAAVNTDVHPEPYLGLATIAMQRSDYDAAMTLYKKALAVLENDKALTGIGLIEMETGKHEDAFAHFRRALELNPGNLIAVNGLLREGYNLKRLDEVVDFMKRFLDVVPEKDGVRFSLAGCLIMLDRKAEARAELEQILRNSPDFAEAQELYALAS